MAWQTAQSFSTSRILIAIAVVSLALKGTATIRAGTLTVGATRDVTLYSEADDKTDGSGDCFFAGRNSASSNSIRRAVIRFDMAAAIPAGATIESATLTLCNDATNIAPALISLHRATRNWGEGASLATSGQGSGVSAAAGDATWVHRFHPSVNCATPGGDCEASASVSALVAGPSFRAWPSSASLVAEVRAFLDDPSGNFGWLLRGDETVYSSAKRFATREAAEPALRRALTIEFTPVPEPLSGLPLFVLLLARSRRPHRHFSRRTESCHAQSSPTVHPLVCGS